MSWLSSQCRLCAFLFIPCVLRTSLPPLEDLWLMATFAMTQFILYSLNNLRGMLFLATLVLLLWTKNIIRRWYRRQMLTREFFGKMLYMMATGIVALLATAYVWLPLYEAYACVAGKLDKHSYKLAMHWRDLFFVCLAFLILLSAANTDIVLRASRIDETGMQHMVVRLVTRLAKLCCCSVKALSWLLKNSCRSMKTFNSQLARVTRHPCSARWTMGRQYGRTVAASLSEESMDDMELADLTSKSPTPKRPKSRARSRANKGGPGASPRSSGTSVVVSTSHLLKQCVKERAAACQPKATAKRSSTSVVVSTSQLLKRCVTPPPVTEEKACCNLRPQGRRTLVVEKPSGTTSPPVTRSKTRMMKTEGRGNKEGRGRSKGEGK